MFRKSVELQEDARAADRDYRFGAGRLLYRRSCAKAFGGRRQGRCFRLSARPLRVDPYRCCARSSVDQGRVAPLREDGADATMSASSAMFRSAGTSPFPNCRSSMTQWCWRRARRTTGSSDCPARIWTTSSAARLSSAGITAIRNFAALDPDLCGKHAVVIGNGNVALDVARILQRPATNSMAATSSPMPSNA